MKMKIAIATGIELKDGRAIWVPPSGRAYWIEYPNSYRDLTEDELDKYVRNQEFWK